MRVSCLAHPVENRLVDILAYCASRDREVHVDRAHVAAIGIEQVGDPSADEHDVITKGPQHVQYLDEHGAAGSGRIKAGHARASCQRFAASCNGPVSSFS